MLPGGISSDASAGLRHGLQRASKASLRRYYPDQVIRVDDTSPRRSRHISQQKHPWHSFILMSVFTIIILRLFVKRIRVKKIKTHTAVFMRCHVIKFLKLAVKLGRIFKSCGFRDFFYRVVSL